MDEQQKENVQRTKPGPPRSAVEKRSVVVSRQLRTTEHRTNKLETNPAMFTIRTKISDHPTNRAVMVKINRKLTNRFAEIFGEKESNLVADSKRTGMSIVSSTRAMTSTETTNSTAITAPPAEKTPTQVSSRGLTPTFENIRSIENHSNAGTPIQLNSMVKSKRTAKEILPEAATSRTAITTPPAEKTLMKTVPTVFSTAITIPNFQDIRSTQNHSNDSSPNESKPTIKSIIAITSSSSANEAQGTPMVKSEEPSFHSIPNLPPALNFEEAFEMVAAYFRNQTQQTTTIDSSNYGAADEQQVPQSSTFLQDHSGIIDYQDPEVQNLDNFPAVVSSSSPSEPDHFDMEKTVKTISNLFVDFTNDITATVTQISEKHSSQQSAQNGKIDHLGKYIKEEFEKLFKAIQYCIKKSNNESHSKMEVAIREMKTEQDQKHEIMMKKLDEKLETMMQKLDNVANATKPEVISIEERLKINDFETEQKSVEANKLAPQTSSNSSKSSNECPKILPAQGSSTKTSRKRSTTSTSESAVPIKKDRKRMTCAWCGGRHFETDCSTFTRWSERLFVAQRKHLCLNCVRHKNDVACRKPPQICHCGANHFRALCPIRFP